MKTLMAIPSFGATAMILPKGKNSATKTQKPDNGKFRVPVPSTTSQVSPALIRSSSWKERNAPLP